MQGDDQAPDEFHTQAVDGDVVDGAPQVHEPSVTAPDAPAHDAPAADTALDLDAIQQDLADVEVALARLDAGTYWTDEVTGEVLPAELLAEHPTARRA